MFVLLGYSYIIKVAGVILLYASYVVGVIKMVIFTEVIAKLELGFHLFVGFLLTLTSYGTLQL